MRILKAGDVLKCLRKDSKRDCSPSRVVSIVGDVAVLTNGSEVYKEPIEIGHERGLYADKKTGSTYTLSQNE